MTEPRASSETFDLIVIGGGSAGCAAASRLVTRYRISVLLLESGRDKQNPLAAIPAGTVKMWFGQTGYVGRFHSESQARLNGWSVPLKHGRVIAGRSHHQHDRLHARLASGLRQLKRRRQAGNRKELELVIQWSYEQKMIPRRLSVDELFDDTTAALN